MLSDNKCDLTLRDKKIVLPLDKGHFITGLYNLKEIVDSYHGMLIVSNETINSEMYIVFEIEV